MKFLVAGCAGFLGSKIVEYLRIYYPSSVIFGIDNLSRKGSETNLDKLKELGCYFYKGDVSVQGDVDSLGRVDWVIDCAANPSVLAGLTGGTERLMRDNLFGSVCLLEKCKRDSAGFIMISTSRVYNIANLSSLNYFVGDKSFVLLDNQVHQGVSSKGITEDFSTKPPVSLYGVTKVASEVIALEYSYSFGFPCFVNRCGVIAGPGQFGRIDQGIFSYWAYQYILNGKLSYIGFEGSGKQVRDAIHPFDVFELIVKQLKSSSDIENRIFNIGGGLNNAWSLLQLNDYCQKCLGRHIKVLRDDNSRKFDIPIYISDYSLAEKVFGWTPSIGLIQIMEEVVKFGKDNLSLIEYLGEP